MSCLHCTSSLLAGVFVSIGLAGAQSFVFENDGLLPGEIPPLEPVQYTDITAQTVFPDPIPGGEDLSWTVFFYDDAEFPGYDPLPDFSDEFRSGDGIEVIVLHDTETGPATLFHVLSDGSLEVLEELGEINMGSGETLLEFIEYGKTLYPADRYMMAMYDHGGGCAGACIDVTSGNDIVTMQEMKTAFTASGGIDILAFTAPCLMGSLESAYQLRDCVEVYIGSEEISGYICWRGAMDDIANVLKLNPELPTLNIAGTIIDLLEQNFTYPYGEQTTIAAVMPAKLADLIESLDLFSIYLYDNMDDLGSSLEIVRGQVYQMGVIFGYEISEIDFRNLLEIFASEEPDPIIQAYITEMMELYDEALINECHGSQCPDANGLSIFFPVDGTGNDYSSYCLLELDMLDDTEWEEALSAYYAYLEMGTGHTGADLTAINPVVNPVSGSARFVCTCDETGNATITISDIAGRRVYSDQLWISANQPSTHSWSITDTHGKPVPAGVYLVRLTGPSGITAATRLVLTDR